MQGSLLVFSVILCVRVRTVVVLRTNVVRISAPSFSFPLLLPLSSFSGKVHRHRSSFYSAWVREEIYDTRSLSRSFFSVLGADVSSQWRLDATRIPCAFKRPRDTQADGFRPRIPRGGRPGVRQRASERERETRKELHVLEWKENMYILSTRMNTLEEKKFEAHVVHQCWSGGRQSSARLLAKWHVFLQLDEDKPLFSSRTPTARKKNTPRALSEESKAFDPFLIVDVSTWR